MNIFLIEGKVEEIISIAEMMLKNVYTEEQILLIVRDDMHE